MPSFPLHACYRGYRPRLFGLRGLFVRGIGCLMAGMPALTAEWIDTTTRDGAFYVVGQSFDATQTVVGIAGEMGGLGMDYFPFPDHLDPIIVELRPGDEPGPDKPPPFTIAPETGGQLRVVINWNDERTFDEVCQALASGFLRRVANHEFGPQAHSRTPPWLELGFGQLLQARLRPAYNDRQARLAESADRLSLDAIVNAQGPFDPVEMETLGVNAVWLLRLIESQASDRQLLRRGLVFLLGGGAFAETLERLIGPTMAKPAERELWWAVGFAQMVRGKAAPFYDMETSRALTRRLAVVTAAIDGSDRRLAGQPIWDFRDEATVRLAVALRLQELKLEMQKVNPVYFNALLSLGLYLESVLAGDAEQAPVRLEAFESDWRTAHRMELEITRLLRW